jgi:hypothetical protein
LVSQFLDKVGRTFFGASLAGGGILRLSFEDIKRLPKWTEIFLCGYWGRFKVKYLGFTPIELLVQIDDGTKWVSLAEYGLRPYVSTGNWEEKQWVELVETFDHLRWQEVGF